ncbi:16S rRNA (uracil1498-N3)-methyltransferase [Cerasibacillus quisquiliarum]|uniref:Ribosomal RNA small subunit methyltransferase E n=1 Tax=Cerasibacillus quisquiliarum TaxID=227865 RepID=A0A511UWQ1_9BACI|nr:16S rRNA (uracil(1498)-N(3))-methyltransferase [Cerasibacillus quisquiliarum]MBB5145548.1 16S rRNA (uracil1498-N3)-methyltransferase [Cerasibacillus quisquiliarum]GEN31056.1 ribosomal RNA small subunit methyltransferase E [Cerasibacillus quisquiliarum]
MQRYFIPSNNWHDQDVIIKGQDAHHLIRVLRSHIGDQVICNNTDGKAAICAINAIADKEVQLKVKEWLTEDNELPIHVTIAQGLPKGDKIDFVLQKGTELGAHAFIPFSSKRSVVKWDDKKSRKKHERFSRIVKEASEQSHRNRIPKVYLPMNLNELLKISQSFDIKIFAYEEEAKVEKYHSFSTIVKKLKKDQSLLLCIGPEGGFAEEEVALLKKNGFTPVRLGPRILRTETAALYALASLSYQFEELGCF